MKVMHKKTKTRLLTQYFLAKLHQAMHRGQVHPMNKLFLTIYSKDELQDIITWLFIPTVPERIKFDEMDKEELLEAIGDEFHILSYEIEQARLELLESAKVTQQRVRNTLEQLGMETHYLMEKPVDVWDEYDNANYNALSYKAGNPVPVFGIYNSDVNEADKYIVTTPPARFYSSEQEANDVLTSLIETGQFKKGEVKIMML